MSKKDEKKLGNLIEQTLMEAYMADDITADLKGEGHTHSEVFSEEKKKTSKKIPGVMKEDGSACCGGGCCELPEKKEDGKLNKKQFLDIINMVTDPETAVGITDMGLIYDVEQDEAGAVKVTMTLTSMGCPAGGQITTEIDSMLRLQPSVTDVKIDIVWTPPWHPEMMNPDVKAMLFGNN